MGLQNLKLEVESFQFQPFPQFGTLATTSPVKTEASPVISEQFVSQLASQLNQLTFVVGQVHQAVLGRAFTNAAPQSVAEGTGLVEEVRKLSQRMEELEARTGKG